MKHWPSSVIDRSGRPVIQVEHKDDKKTKLRKKFPPWPWSLGTAEAYLGMKVTHAVVGVPTHFNAAQRQATKATGTTAGLNIRLVAERSVSPSFPSTVVYVLASRPRGSIGADPPSQVFEVLATAGDDFDNRVQDYMNEQYKKKTDVSTKEARALAKLKREVEQAKRTLSSQTSTKLEFESFENGNDFSETSPAPSSKSSNMDLCRKTLKPVEATLAEEGGCRRCR